MDKNTTPFQFFAELVQGFQVSLVTFRSSQLEKLSPVELSAINAAHAASSVLLFCLTLHKED